MTTEPQAEPTAPDERPERGYPPHWRPRSKPDRNPGLAALLGTEQETN